MGKELENQERLPVSVSSAVFIEDGQGKLLLLQQAAERKGHRWGPPAGGMEAHENPMMAAHRETEEEIGVDVKLKDLVGIYVVDRGDHATGIGFVFRGQIASGEIAPRKKEIMNSRFFSPEEIEELIETDMLYKPEYNLPGIRDWIEGKSFALEVIRALRFS